MEFLKPGNFNGLIFRDGMVFVSEIDKWITKEEYKKYKDEHKKFNNGRRPKTRRNP